MPLVRNDGFRRPEPESVSIYMRLPDFAGEARPIAPSQGTAAGHKQPSSARSVRLYAPAGRACPISRRCRNPAPCACASVCPCLWDGAERHYLHPGAENTPAYRIAFLMRSYSLDALYFSRSMESLSMKSRMESPVFSLIFGSAPLSSSSFTVSGCSTA